MFLFDNFLFLADFTTVEPLGLLIFWTCLILLTFTVGIASSVHIYRNDFKNNTLRIFWLLSIILTAGFVGWFYWFQRKKFLLDEDNLSD